MNWAQKLASQLLGWDYIAEVWDGSVYVRRVRKVSKFWVLSHGGGRLLPGGKLAGQGAYWEPLTPRVARFHRAETL